MAALDIPYERYVELNGSEHCGICGCEPPPHRKLDRDHDHATGKPRGLLCRKHNRMLKRWLTDDFMRLALAYLERTK
jgi:hypothetical protein